jgi:hypothetical protein
MCLKVQRDGARRSRDGGAQHRLCQDGRAGAQPLVNFRQGVVKLAADRHLLLWRQIQAGEQVVHEEAVAQVGGHAPGAGVRVREQPHPFERGQVIADRRRADAEIVAPDDACAAHWLRCLHKFLDDNPQHLALAFGDRVNGEWFVVHRSIRVAIGAKNRLQNCANQDCDVQANRPVFNIPQVVFGALHDRGVAAQSR